MYIPSKYVIKLVSGLEENVKTQVQNSTISIGISKLSIAMKAWKMDISNYCLIKQTNWTKTNKLLIICYSTKSCVNVASRANLICLLGLGGSSRYTHIFSCKNDSHCCALCCVWLFCGWHNERIWNCIRFVIYVWSWSNTIRGVVSL